MAELYVAKDAVTGKMDLLVFTAAVVKFVKNEAEKRSLESFEIVWHWIVSNKAVLGHQTKAEVTPPDPKMNSKFLRVPHRHNRRYKNKLEVVQ